MTGWNRILRGRIPIENRKGVTAQRNADNVSHRGHVFHNALTSPSQALRTIACIMILAALNVFVFWDHWRGATSFTFDFPMNYYASAAYWITSIQAGEWPHWIPYESMGYPAILNPQLGLFYPPLWIFALARIPYTLHLANVVQVLHVLFGSLGLFFLARRVFRNDVVALCGGICFGLFGGFFTNAEHVDIIRALSWTPWINLVLFLDGPGATYSVGYRRFSTRLSVASVWQPLAISWFVCGAYPGILVSLLFVSTVFILTQASVLFQHSRAMALRDGTIQMAGVILGLLMSSAFLIPTAYMSRELTRTQDASIIAREYLKVQDLLNLAFPSNLINGADYSMLGMQAPLVLLLMLPLAWRYLGRLTPFLAAAGAAAIMGFSEMKGASLILIRLVPMLGLSRFPGGEYRVFIYMAVLMCGLAGIDAALRIDLSALWRNIALMLIVLAMLLLGGMRLLASLASPHKEILFRFLLVAVGYAAVTMASYAVRNVLPRLRVLFVAILSVSLAAGGIQVAAIMTGYWSDPQIEAAFYTNRGLPLVHGNMLAAAAIFSDVESTRPRRKDSKSLLDLSWRGYIDGSYMMSDLSNMRSLAQRAIAGDPTLVELMREANEIFLIPCAGRICSGESVASTALANQLSATLSVRYSRNEILYGITPAVRSLAVENEIYAPGWTATCKTHGEHLSPVRVAGALRGWVLNPGFHELMLRYRTPFLSLGMLISAFAYGIWGAGVAILLWFNWYRPCTSEPSRRTARV
jgi:hypothetical protein